MEKNSTPFLKKFKKFNKKGQESGICEQILIQVRDTTAMVRQRGLRLFAWHVNRTSRNQMSPA